MTTADESKEPAGNSPGKPAENPATHARANPGPSGPARDMAAGELLTFVRSREREVRARWRAARTDDERDVLGELADTYDALVRVVAHHRGCGEQCVAMRAEDIGPFARGFLAGDSRCLTVAEVAGALGVRGHAGGRPAGG